MPRILLLFFLFFFFFSFSQVSHSQRGYLDLIEEGQYNRAFRMMRTYAQQYKSPAAQYNLAIHYYDGQGTDQDYDKAYYWYKKSAKQGFVKAQNNLGYMYKTGDGIPRDYERAYYWFNRAHHLGNANATLNLAYLYDLRARVLSRITVRLRNYIQS